MTSQDNAPIFLTLQKITASYVMEQDRIRLTAAAGDQQTVVYWLTRRMLGILIKPMFDWVSQRTESAFNANDPNTAAQQRSQAAKLAMANNSAQAKVQREDPVIADDGCIEHLLKSVDVKTEDRRFLIMLPIDDERRGVIPFEQENLLQWLGIIYRVQREAEWNIPYWPLWFSENQNITPLVPSSKNAALH